VTIIAGFKCNEGVVLCADTQESISVGGVPLSKRNVPKLRFEHSRNKQINNDEFAAAFCGAGSGPFVDKLIDEAWKAAQASASLDEVCLTIEASIKNTYEEFGQIYQPGYCPQAELIYGVKMQGNSRLFIATGPIVNEKQEYYACGAGYYMADFLAKRIYRDYLSLYQCAILAAYVLFQAKEHVDGCGGDSQIAVLRNDGTSGRVESARIAAITELLHWADEETGRFLLDAANLEMDDAEFKKVINLSGDILGNLRSGRKQEIETKERSVRLMFGMGEQKKDEFGLPLPSLFEDTE
jgi:hypothetical protein